VPSNAVLERLAAERGTVHEMVESILAGAEADDRDPTESERELLARHKGRLAELEVQIAELADVAEQVAGARDVAPLIRRDHAPQPVAAAPEAPTTIYRTYGQFARDELIARYDLIASHAGGDEVRRASRERLAANDLLVRAVANTLTADVPGLVPPQHLAQITDVINKSRPIVSNSRQVALSSGKLTYPKITQRPVVGKQTAEKTELPSQKMIVAMNEVLADTFGGSGDLSWQAINWSTPDALGLYFDLMAEAYAITTETEAGTVLGSGTNPDVELASDDYPGWYAALNEAAATVYANSKRFADTVYASPSLGFHLRGLVSNLTPAFGAGGFAGLTLVTSAGLVGNACIVANAQSLLVAETAGAPVEMRAVEPSIGGMEVGVIGAFVAELVDPTATCGIINAVPLVAAAQAKPAGNGK
jgi:HK97 family phage major capsid protein